MTRRDCPVCLNQSKFFVFGHIARCHNCGMSYKEFVPTQPSLDKYYAEMSKYEIEAGTELDKHFKEHAENLYHFIDGEFLKDLNILDIGCSNGYFLDVIKNNNKDCYLLGIDPSKKCVENTIKKGINAQQATINTFKPDREYYNLTCLSAVLEHLVRPREAIKKIADMQACGDSLLIVVPALEYFSSYIHVPFQQFNTEHINYFRMKDIENLLSIYGYEILYNELHKTKRTNNIIEPDWFIYAGKKGNIFDYVKESEKKQKELISKLNKKLEGKDNIIVWGAGECSKWLLDAHPVVWEKISCFVDNDNRIHDFSGLTVITPDKINDNCPILISSMAHSNEIEKQIKDMGLTNEVIRL
jgi:trans-aconitate methyltransferase